MRKALCFIALAGTACAHGATLDLAAERAALKKADLDWQQATATGGREGFASFVADQDLAFISGGAATRNRDTIIKAWEPMYTHQITLEWSPTEAQVSSSGDLGYTIGTWHLTAGTVEDTGTYCTIWRKQNGKWKATVDLGSSKAKN